MGFDIEKPFLENIFRYQKNLLKYNKEVFVLCYFPSLLIADVHQSNTDPATSLQRGRGGERERRRKGEGEEEREGRREGEEESRHSFNITLREPVILSNCVAQS